jgi:hypothetical protein
MEIVEKYLWIDTGHYAAVSIWEKRGAGWVCTYAEPLIGWMKGAPALEVRDRLESAGTFYKWCNPTDRGIALGIAFRAGEQV